MEKSITIPNINIPSINRFDTESNIVYNYRVNYITTNLSNINKDLSIRDLIKNSKILANIKFKNCKYDTKIYKKI